MGDWDRFGTNDDMGHIDLSENEIMNIYNTILEEKRSIEKTYHIISPESRKNEKAGTLTIRFRIPCDIDINNAYHRSDLDKSKIRSFLQAKQKVIVQQRSISTVSAEKKEISTSTSSLV